MKRKTYSLKMVNFLRNVVFPFVHLVTIQSHRLHPIILIRNSETLRYIDALELSRIEASAITLLRLPCT